MPTLTVTGRGTFDVADGTRLVRAIEGNGVDILHRCGGFARCTTCRVAFTTGEPTRMTVAEHDKLAEKELLGAVRLSCQIICDHDIAVRAISRLAGSGRKDAGQRPADDIQPQPIQWVDK